MNKNIEILGKLNLIDKIKLISGSNFFKTKRVNAEIGSIRFAKATFGVLKEDRDVFEEKFLPSTSFPCASMLACSFDRDLIKMYAKALSIQARAYDVDILFAPSLNIKRNLLGGKNYELFSEDPYLTSELGLIMVKSIQNMGVGACLKNFIISNQRENRMRLNAIVDERALKEIYLYSFYKILKKVKPYAIMVSDNKVNGVRMTESRRFLIDILREQMSYEGLLISNYGGVFDRRESVKCGLDLKLPMSLKEEENALLKAVQERRINESDIDKCCLRLIRTIKKCKQNKSIKKEHFTFENMHLLAREIASQTMVLLKNEDDFLPLYRGSKLGVIGVFAEKPIFQAKEEFSTNPIKVDTFIEELDNEGVEYKYARGFDPDSDEEFDEYLLNESKTLATMQDQIIVFCGNVKQQEFSDKEDFELPKNQKYLLEEITKINQNVVVVVLNDGWVNLSFCQDRIKGILYAGLSGESTMGAVSDILFGDKNPCGKLSETFLNKVEEMPCYPQKGYIRQEYKDSIFVGYRYYNTVNADIAYPFGYGLTYTQFEYSNLIISSNNFKAGGIIDVSIDLENVGELDGAEIVQLYVRRKGESPIPMPDVILKGFEKEFLSPGSKRTVYFELTDDTFSFHNVLTNTFEVLSGEYEILIGENSRSFMLSTTVTVEENDLVWSRVSDEYYNLTLPLNISNDAFYKQNLLNETKQGAHLKYDLDSTLEDLEGTKSAELINKRYIKKLSPREKEKYSEIIKKVPLRTLSAFSLGKINIKRLDSYIDFANGRKMSGFAKLMGSILKRKVF